MDTTYWQRSLIELTTPGLFFLCFAGLMGVGLLNLSKENFVLFMLYPLALLYFFCYHLRKWSKIEKGSDKGENTDGKMDG